MSKSASLNMRVDPEMRKNAERVFNEMGITLTGAVNMFFAATIREQGIPFELRTQPRYNKNTEEAMKEAEQIARGKVKSAFDGSIAELFESHSEE